MGHQYIICIGEGALSEDFILGLAKAVRGPASDTPGEVAGREGKRRERRRPKGLSVC